MRFNYILVNWCQLIALVVIDGWIISSGMECLGYFSREEMAILINDANILPVNGLVGLGGVFRNGRLAIRFKHCGQIRAFSPLLTSADANPPFFFFGVLMLLKCVLFFVQTKVMARL